MKKFLFLLTGLMCMLVSCGGGEDSPNEPTPTPNPTPNEPTASITMNTNIPSGGLAFDVNGGEKSVSFTTNKDWTVTVAATTGGATWCTASPASGSQGDATVKFSVKENTDYDDRSVSVTIKAGTATKTFTINQKGADALLVTTKKYEVAQEGGEIEVEVQANIDYEMEISETAKSWISEASTRALTTHKHTFTIAANEELEKREGEIIFKSGDKVETVTVYQAGGPVLLLSKNEFNVSDAGETITIEVKSNVDFGVQLPDVDWIVDEASTRGMSSHTLKYDILSNETYDAREAEIIFYDKNSDLKETVKVVQVQKDAIIISQKNYEVVAEGETIEVKLSANVDFDVTIPDVDWITQVTTRGLTEHTLYYSIAENTSEDSRSAEIVFTNKDSQISEKISIIQKAPLQASYIDGVATLAKAGTLKEVLGNDYLNITSLKVIGPLNGTDIRLIREMAGRDLSLSKTNGSLVDLDISKATIVEGGGPYINYSDYLYTSPNVIGGLMFGYLDNLREIILPDNVTAINYMAFYGCSSLKSVTIGNSVTSIRNQAFYGCQSLKSVTIGNSVTSIGNQAFYGCQSLTSVTIPNSVTSIGEKAFNNCDALTSIIIPDNVTSIGEYAFENCSSLTSVTIGNSVTSIGDYAFHGCSSLTSVTIGNSVTSIGNQAFTGCSFLTYVYIHDLSAWCKIDFVDWYSNPLTFEAILYLNNEEITELLIPNDVTEIKKYAFNGCQSLTSVTIPNSVTSIGGDAFEECSSLTSVTIGNSVTSIGGDAFGECSSLTSVTIGNSVTSIGGYAFQECNALSSVYISDLSAWCRIDFVDRYSNPLYKGAKLYLNNNEVTDLVIPDDITEIKKYAFEECSSLTSVTIPNSVTSIGGSAFEECSSLTSVTIGNSVTSIGEYAFENCSSLTSVTIGNSVTSIGEFAFYSCKSLTSVTIGNSVTSIGEKAFNNCDALSSVYISDLSAWCRIDFFDSCSNPLYKGAKLYLNNNEVTDLVIPDDITEIKKYAFEECSSLTSVTIPNSVTSIGGYAFYNCDAITSVTIGNSIPSIGDYAFCGCDSLTSVTIGKGVTSISKGAFLYCNQLTDFYCYAIKPPRFTSNDSSKNFSHKKEKSRLYVPVNRASVYATSDWARYFNTISEMEE